MHSQTLRGHRASLLLRSRVPHQVSDVWMEPNQSSGAGVVQRLCPPLNIWSRQQLCDVSVSQQELYSAGGLGETATGLDQSRPE